MIAALRTLLSLRPDAAVEKITVWGRRLAIAHYQDRARQDDCTYLEPDNTVLAPPMLAKTAVDVLAPMAGTFKELTGHILAHRFDLLGSGWTDAGYGARPHGFQGISFPHETGDHGDLTLRVNPGNRRRAQHLRDLIDAGYIPIDWHRDLRSGFRWRENKLSAALLYGHVPGADVKSPWELARLQHLPWLAWSFVLASADTEGFQPRETYFREFRNQALDFLAANPPGFGVNWMCTMDVAIRAANLALAHDIFRAQGVEFDAGFTAEMVAALRGHGRHIERNLEWHAERRGNHYLANICGLAFIARSLPRDDETDRWIAFATQELIAETERQFNRDGSNFEASTSYHRLSAEMATYATAVLMGLPADRRVAFRDYNHLAWVGAARLFAPPLPLHTLPNGDATRGPFPAAHFRRLEKAADFSAHITKPNGHVIQIGDNDSGRFFKLSPTLEDTPDGPRESHLDHRGLVGAVNGLFGRADRTDFAGDAGAVETHVIAALANTVLNSYREPGKQAAAAGRGTAESEVPGAGKHPRPSFTTTIRLPDPSVLEDLYLCQYPDFGLYLWVSRRLFLAVRCGPAARDGIGGHAHNDQLSIELNVDGEDWIADPGSYVYTADLKARNAYRSVRAHAAPRCANKEPASLTQGPFRLTDRSDAECHGFQPKHFTGVHYGYGFPQVRTISLEKGAIVVVDTPGDGIAKDQYAAVHNAAEARAVFGMDLPFTSGYGHRVGDAVDDD